MISATTPIAPGQIRPFRREDIPAVVVLRDRLDAGIMNVLAGTSATFSKDGPWTLTHAHDPELMAVITEGAGFLTRLDPEWSLNF